MSEQIEGFGVINTNGERHEMTRDNTSLFNHLGRLALYDHLFVIFPDETGVYIWSTNPSYEQLAALAVEHECIMHLNLQAVAEIDERNYLKHHTGDLKEFDTIPDDWV